MGRSCDDELAIHSNDAVRRYDQPQVLRSRIRIKGLLDFRHIVYIGQKQFNVMCSCGALKCR